MNNIIFAIIILFNASVLSKEKTSKKQELIPHFSSIAAAENNSTLSMECTGSAPYAEIDCSFVQVVVATKNEDEINKKLIEFDKDFSNLKESEIVKKLEEPCTLSKGDYEKKYDWHLLSNEKKKFIEDDFEKFSRVCKCLKNSSVLIGKNKKECITSEMKELELKKIKSCRVWTNTFELSFKRVDVNKWLSNPGPKGICDFVNIATIEKEEKSDFLWNFSQTRVTGDTKSDLCKGFDYNKPVVFSWKHPTQANVNCENITF